MLTEAYVRNAPTFRRGSGVVRPVLGLDWIERPVFDASYPGVREWVRADGAEIVIRPDLSGGRVTQTDHEIIVRY